MIQGKNEANLSTGGQMLARIWLCRRRRLAPRSSIPPFMAAGQEKEVCKYWPHKRLGSRNLFFLGVWPICTIQAVKDF
jgi:hypothetical protein